MMKLKLLRSADSQKLLTIPQSALKLCGMAEEPALLLRTDKAVMVLLKPEMTAMELIQTTGALRQLALELTVHLAKLCGSCSDCAEGSCPCEDDPLQLPDHIRQEAGIPKEAKLCACVDREAHAVTVSQADHRYDLEDVPETDMALFRAVRTCLGELEEHLMVEDIVYGE